MIPLAHIATETFLPFDLEQAFSSAFVLTLMTAIPGLPDRDTSYMDTTFEIIDTMIARGNVVARFRKEELEKLQEMLHLATLRFQAPNEVSMSGDQAALNPSEGLGTSNEGLVDRGPATGSTVNGLASEKMLSIAGLLDWEPNMSALGDDQLAGSWLWDDDITQNFDFSGGLL